jgi:hypothetical protein
MKRIMMSSIVMVSIATFADAESYPIEGSSLYKLLFGIDSDLAYYNRIYIEAEHRVNSLLDYCSADLIIDSFGAGLNYKF